MLQGLRVLGRQPAPLSRVRCTCDAAKTCNSLPMKIQVRLAGIRLTGGDEVSIARAGVTCVVGGNNVGKSQLLREIATRFASADQASSVVVEDVQINKQDVGADEVDAFLRSYGVAQRTQPGQRQIYTSEHGGSHISAPDFLTLYQASGALQAVSQFFVWYASAGSLLGMASGSAPIGMGEPIATNPIGRLFRDGDLEAELSKLSISSFDVPLTLDRINGDARLKVGKPTLPAPPIDRPTREYSDEVANLPDLESQGDGIKSFLGLAISVLAGSSQVLLVDEPEAFLHPSQARTLGRWLAKQALDRDLQVIVATHDRDLLLGLLDAGESAGVTVLRLTRDGNDNRIHELPPAEIARVWGDPVLRYSNLLQGLFHRRVVICEADADCRFYGAVLDVLSQEQNLRSRSDNTLFVPSGGKQRVASMAKALGALGVDTWTILDFDVLRQRDDLRTIVESLGHGWSETMNANYVRLAEAVNQGQLWPTVKHQGLSGVPAGQANAAAADLVSALRHIGIVIVPVGEMEDFDKSSALHGSAWVTAMLEAGVHRTSAGARDLLRPLLQY